MDTSCSASPTRRCGAVDVGSRGNAAGHSASRETCPGRFCDVSLDGTASYRRCDAPEAVPSLVVAAVENAEKLGFDLCVRPEIGRLLALLAAGLPTGSLVGETGTGTGAGLAWMVTAAHPSVRFISYEHDDARARVAGQLFKGHPNVEVVCADAAALFDRGPATYLSSTEARVQARHRIRRGRSLHRAATRGTMTIDDYTPSSMWPPLLGDDVDAGRMHWLSHSQLRSTEIRVASDVAVIVGRYLPDR